VRGERWISIGSSPPAILAQVIALKPLWLKAFLSKARWGKTKNGFITVSENTFLKSISIFEQFLNIFRESTKTCFLTVI
jgi:hypothetical protein